MNTALAKSELLNVYRSSTIYRSALALTTLTQPLITYIGIIGIGGLAQAFLCNAQGEREAIEYVTRNFASDPHFDSLVFEISNAENPDTCLSFKRLESQAKAKPISTTNLPSYATKYDPNVQKIMKEYYDKMKQDPELKAIGDMLWTQRDRNERINAMKAFLRSRNDIVTKVQGQYQFDGNLVMPQIEEALSKHFQKPVKVRKMNAKKSGEKLIRLVDFDIGGEPKKLFVKRQGSTFADRNSWFQAYIQYAQAKLDPKHSSGMPIIVDDGSDMPIIITDALETNAYLGDDDKQQRMEAMKRLNALGITIIDHGTLTEGEVGGQWARNMYGNAVNIDLDATADILEDKRIILPSAVIADLSKTQIQQAQEKQLYG